MEEVKKPYGPRISHVENFVFGLKTRNLHGPVPSIQKHVDNQQSKWQGNLVPKLTIFGSFNNYKTFLTNSIKKFSRWC